MESTVIGTTSYKQLIEQSIELYRASFATVILPSFLLALTVFLPRLVFFITGTDYFANIDVFHPRRLWIIALDLVSILFFVWILWHMHCIKRQRHEPLIEDFTVGLKKTLSVFVAVVIQCAIMFGMMFSMFGLQILLHTHEVLTSGYLAQLFLLGFILLGQFCLILYVATLFIFLIPLIAVENNSIFVALEKSVLLAWNHAIRILSAQVTPWLTFLFILILLRHYLNINFHFYFLTALPFSIESTIIQLMLFALFIPWAAALLLVQLDDLENRKKLSQQHD